MIKGLFMKKFLLSIAILLLIASCSVNPKLNKKIVKQAVDDMLKDQQVCVRAVLDLDYAVMPDFQLGNQIVKIQSKNTEGHKVNSAALKQMELLNKAKIYKQVGSEEIKLQSNISIFNNIYQLTDKGQSLFSQSDKKLCIGKYEFGELKYYSEPARDKGRRISYVTYTVKTDIEKWAKPFLKSKGKDYLKYLEQDSEHVSVFYLTNKGWKVLKDNI